MRIARRIDQLLAVLKWPAALAGFLLLLGLLPAWYRLVCQVSDRFRTYVPFFTGFIVYLAAWLLFLRKPAWGSYFSTFEHEATHALFAVLTMHRVTGLTATWRRGGQVTFSGKGNWLITTAPYFFPTVAVALAVPLALVPARYVVWLTAALGAAASYHLTSTWKETHMDQPDLQEAGLLFAFLFLPAANLFFFGVLTAFSGGGLDSASSFVSHTGSALSTNLDRIMRHFGL